MPGRQSIFLALASAFFFIPFTEAFTGSLREVLSSDISSDLGSWELFLLCSAFSRAGFMSEVLRESASTTYPIVPSFLLVESVLPADSSAIFAPDFSVCSQDSLTAGFVGFVACSNLPRGLFLDSKFYITAPGKRMSELRALVVTRPEIADKTITGPGSSTPDVTTVTASQPFVDLPSISVAALLQESFVVDI